MLTDLLPAWHTLHWQGPLAVELVTCLSRRCCGCPSPAIRWPSQQASKHPAAVGLQVYICTEYSVSNARLGRITASRCSPYDPLDPLSFSPFPAVRWPSPEIASARGRFHFLLHHRCLGASPALSFCLLGSAPGPPVPCPESCLSIVSCLWLCHFALLRRRFLILARHSTVFRRFFCRDPTTTVSLSFT